MITELIFFERILLCSFYVKSVNNKNFFSRDTFSESQKTNDTEITMIVKMLRRSSEIELGFILM